MAQRRALVVGAARGIGLAIAGRLSSEGPRVTATWNSQPPPDSRLDQQQALQWERCDITDPASVSHLFEAATSEEDPYEIVVANSAIVRDRMASRMTEKDFTSVIDVNLTGTFRVIKASIGPMTQRRWGRIVVISSVGGWYGNAGQANYAASKAAQLGMARSLAREIGPRNVTVNLVCPATIETELITSMSPRLQKRWTEMLPIGRMGKPDDVAAAVSYLTSERSGFVTGTMLPVDGGLLA